MASLKDLEADKLINHITKPIIPPHVEYRITKSGEELRPVLLPMKRWAIKHNI